LAGLRNTLRRFEDVLRDLEMAWGRLHHRFHQLDIEQEMRAALAEFDRGRGDPATIKTLARLWL
jgi:hypothetical protein